MDILTQEILIAISGYIAGFISGLFLHNILKNNKFENSDIVLIAVTMIWALSRIVALINTEYQSSPLIDGLMGMIVGFFYKGNLFKKNV